MRKLPIFIILLFLISNAEATQITLAQFSASAIHENFSGASIGATTYTDGNLTITGGIVESINLNPLVGNMFTNRTNGTGAGGTTVITFTNAVSAVGFDGYYNNNPIAFELYDVNNILLTSSLTSPTGYGSISGFFGLSTGINDIKYAKIHMPALENIHNLFLDNVIYQSSPVPEPTSIALLGMGLLGFVASRRKKNQA